MNTKYIPKRQVYEFAVCINIFMKLSKFLSAYLALSCAKL